MVKLYINTKEREIAFQNGLAWCSKCEQFFAISHFYKDKNNRYGLTNWCKDCHKENSKKQRKKHPKYLAQWCSKNQQKMKNYHKKHYTKLKENNKNYNKEQYKKRKLQISIYGKKWRKENKKYSKIYSKEYARENKEQINHRRNAYVQHRQRIDPIFRLRNNLGKSIRKILNNINNPKNGQSICDLVGFTKQQFLDNLRLICKNCNLSKGKKFE